MEQERQQVIAETLQKILNEGERFVVDWHDGQVEVQSIEEANLRPVSEEKPQQHC